MSFGQTQGFFFCAFEQKTQFVQKSKKHDFSYKFVSKNPKTRLLIQFSPDFDQKLAQKQNFDEKFVQKTQNFFPKIQKLDLTTQKT